VKTASTIDDAAAVRAWAARWKRVNEFAIEEQRRTPPAVRLRQFFSLMAMARTMNWHTSTPEEDEACRSRWQRLREAYRAKNNA
jgi:hypothetical protein